MKGRICNLGRAELQTRHLRTVNYRRMSLNFGGGTLLRCSGFLAWRKDFRHWRYLISTSPLSFKLRLNNEPSLLCESHIQDPSSSHPDISQKAASERSGGTFVPAEHRPHDRFRQTLQLCYWTHIGGGLCVVVPVSPRMVGLLVYFLWVCAA